VSFKDSFGLCCWRLTRTEDIYFFAFRDHFFLCNVRRFHQEAFSTQLSNYCPSSQCSSSRHVFQSDKRRFVVTRPSLFCAFWIVISTALV